MAGRYIAPDVPAEQLTLDFVRDELLTCFESAQSEFLELQGQKLPEEELRGQVAQFVKGSFQSCGASFDQPTREGIILAIEECKKNATQGFGEAGVPIIDHHYGEMMKLVSRLSG
ncbi:MAG: hypothetical protein ACE5KH_02775 [Candidatus Geothermarchaeales archaeon]